MPTEEQEALVERRVQEIEQRIVREGRELFACRHQRQADQCDDCKGRTALGVPMDYVVQVLHTHGLMEVELARELPDDGKEPVRNRRSLKTIVGVGIGVSFFLAIVGWQHGGKILARLIKRDAAPPKS